MCYALDMSLTRRDLYHIEFELSENISNLQSKYIEQTKSAYRQNFVPNLTKAYEEIINLKQKEKTSNE